MEEVKKKAGKPATTKIVKTEDKGIEVVKNDNSEVMKLLKEMQLELAKLKEENISLKSKEDVRVLSTTESINEFTSDTEIEVMSLYAGTLNLYTEGFGVGSKYPFKDGYGSIIDIPLGDLKLIVKNNNKIAKDGYFYIMNKEAVSLCRLKKTYESLLSFEQMESISKLSDEQVITLYNSAPESQKELIIEYFANKKASGEGFNHNVMYQLSELSGKKLLVD